MAECGGQPLAGLAQVRRQGLSLRRAAAPERMVWGSDWPHRGEKHMSDDARLLDFLADWAPDARARTRILVDNPATLYGFA